MPLSTNVNDVLRALSILAFFVAGLSCLLAPRMAREFARYELPRFRILTGCLQLFGAAGLAFGLIFPMLTMLSAGGLSTLMLLGVTARLRVKDSLLQIVPAGLLSMLNLIVLDQAVRG